VRFRRRAAALQALAAIFMSVGGSSSPLVGEEPEPEIQFEEEAWDFGTVPEGEKVSHLFSFRNVGGADLFITKVRSSCDCVAATVSLERVAPGEKGGVVVTFDSHARQDKQMSVQGFLERRADFTVPQNRAGHSEVEGGEGGAHLDVPVHRDETDSGR